MSSKATSKAHARSDAAAANRAHAARILASSAAPAVGWCITVGHLCVVFGNTPRASRYLNASHPSCSTACKIETRAVPVRLSSFLLSPARWRAKNRAPCCGWTVFGGFLVGIGRFRPVPWDRQLRDFRNPWIARTGFDFGMFGRSSNDVHYETAS